MLITFCFSIVSLIYSFFLLFILLSEKKVVKLKFVLYKYLYVLILIREEKCLIHYLKKSRIPKSKNLY